MGRFMRKCKGIGELAVMEVSQVVGVRTRARTLALATAAAAASGGPSSKRRKATGPGELQISYLQLRSRSLVMTPQISRSPSNSGPGRRSSPERGRISRCSSNASCEVVDKEEETRFRPADAEGGKNLETVACYFQCSREKRERTPDESGELESTAERCTRRSALSEAMPSEAEIEKFFVAAEKAEKRRFTDTYNYDVDRDVPLDGRYEWVRLKP